MKKACHLKAWCMLLPLFLHGWLMGCWYVLPAGSYGRMPSTDHMSTQDVEQK